MKIHNLERERERDHRESKKKKEKIKSDIAFERKNRHKDAI